MKKIIFTFLLFSLFSCGSISKVKTNTDKETEREKSVNKGKETNRSIIASDYILEPLDTSKPIIFKNGTRIDTVWNTRIINNNRVIQERIKDTVIYRDKFKESENISVKEKETDNTWLILGGIGLLFLFLLIAKPTL